MIIDSFSGDFRALSNFYPSKVKGVDIYLEQFEYATVEHAFQAMKTTFISERQSIARCRTPSEAKRMGRTVEMRADWEEIKIGVMRRLLEQKFRPDVGNALAIDLENTGDALLIEGNDWGDEVWGMVRGRDGWEGQNWLGFMLMAIRAVNRPTMQRQARRRR